MPAPTQNTLCHGRSLPLISSYEETIQPHRQDPGIRIRYAKPRAVFPLLPSQRPAVQSMQYGKTCPKMPGNTSGG